MRRGKDGGGSDCKKNSIVFPIVNRHEMTINYHILTCFDRILIFSMIKNILKNTHFQTQKIISFAHIISEFFLQISRSQDPPVCPLFQILVVGLLTFWSKSLGKTKWNLFLSYLSEINTNLAQILHTCAVLFSVQDEQQRSAWTYEKMQVFSARKNSAHRRGTPEPAQILL